VATAAPGYLFIDYAEAAKQTYTHTKKTIKPANIKGNTKETLKKTYTTDTANVAGRHCGHIQLRSVFRGTVL